jgi:hypothetical protein
MTVLNALLTAVADAVLGPLAGLPALAVIGGAALATALGVLGVMRLTSNQAALAGVKRRIQAGLLEMRLYNDDLRGLVRAQGEVLRHNLRYVGLSLVPLAVTALPLTLAIAQLQAWYGYTGLAPGVPTTITAGVDGTLTALPALEAPALELLGPPRYFPTRREVVWRVVPRQPGPSTARVVTSGGTAVEKTVHVAGGDTTARRSPSRDRAAFVPQLLYPSEAPLPEDAGLSTVRVPYPDRTLRVAGVDMHWLVVYLVLTIVFVLGLRGPLGVVI